MWFNMTICSVCRHECVDAIASALLGGQSVREVASSFDLSKSSVHRHMSTCLSSQLAEARRDGKRVSAAALVDRLRDLMAETRELLEEARTKQDLPCALKAISRLEAQLRMEGEIEGELLVPGTGQTHVSIDLHPEWLRLRGQIVAALGPFPLARVAVVTAIDAPRAA